jgi:GR25 family glycosyltransferase involved in LPS biosynthesis
MEPIDIRNYPIYCINLDKRPDRYKFFMNQPGARELKIERFPAVDGSKLDIVNNPNISNATKYNILNKTRRSHGEIDTIGAIGCSMSHYTVWKKFLESKEPYCLVLEDDAQVKVGLAKYILAASSSKMEGGFDVWCLAYKLHDNKKTVAVPAADSAWKSPVSFWGTSAYIVSRRGAERLIEGFFPIECHLDRYMSLKRMLGQIRIVIHSDLMTYTLPFGTDIQLNKCHLCDYPDDFKDGILVKKYALAIPIAYGFIATFLYLCL